MSLSALDQLVAEAADEAITAAHEALDGIPAQVVAFVAVTERDVLHVRVSVDPIPATSRGRNILASVLNRVADNIVRGEVE